MKTVVCVGVVCLTAIQIVAFMKEQDGAILASCVGGISALITGLAGYEYGARKTLKDES